MTTLTDYELYRIKFILENSKMRDIERSCLETYLISLVEAQGKEIIQERKNNINKNNPVEINLNLKDHITPYLNIANLLHDILSEGGKKENVTTKKR